MARPRKEPHEKRDQRFNLRYTTAEIEHIRSQAQAAGLEPHEYVRRRSLGHSVPPAPSRSGADMALVSELNRIGVNLNQLTRAANSGIQKPSDLSALAAELRSVLAQIVSANGP